MFSMAKETSLSHSELSFSAHSPLRFSGIGGNEPYSDGVSLRVLEHSVK